MDPTTQVDTRLASPRVGALLAGRGADGRLLRGRSVYQKWQGAHWVMAALADLGYPPGDHDLVPMRDQLLDAWLAPEWYDEFECPSKAKAYSRRGVPVMNGRHRRCASQQGNAKVATAVRRAATIFLDRQLFKRRSTGTVIRSEFVQLHYPLYWHYDILGGLKVMGEAA